MITIQTPHGPIQLPAEVAEAVRAALQQRYDDGLQAGYDQARREFDIWLEKAGRDAERGAGWAVSIPMAA